LPLNIGARVDLVGERVFRQTYQFTRLAAVPGLDWTTALPNPGLGWTRPRLALALQGEFELSRVLPVTSANAVTGPLQFSDQQRLRYLFGTFALATIRFLPTLDLRDDPLVPRKGLLFQLETEWTFDLYTRDLDDKYVPVKFFKLGGTVTGYVPLWPRANLALSVRGGKIFPFTEGSVTPPVKRFFLGGSSSMRGFLEDGLIAEDVRQKLDQQVLDCRAVANSAGCTSAAKTLQSGQVVGSQGGELYVLGKSELRFPLIGQLDLGIFFEAGNLWLEAPNAFTLRTVAGAGVRYMTPIGPLALDVGVNLAPDRWINEPPLNLHFNIGYF
jgi:outer membrane protein assembly factor BamA